MKNLFCGLFLLTVAVCAAQANLGDTFTGSNSRWKQTGRTNPNDSWITWSWTDGYIITQQFHGQNACVMAVMDPNPKADVVTQGLRIFQANYNQRFTLTGKYFSSYDGSPENCYSSEDGKVLADITWCKAGGVMFRIGFTSWFQRHHKLDPNMARRDGNPPKQDNDDDDNAPVQDDQVSSPVLTAPKIEIVPATQLPAILSPALRDHKALV